MSLTHPLWPSGWPGGVLHPLDTSMILTVTDFHPLSVSPWGKQRGCSRSTPMCASSFPGDVGTPGNGQAGHAVDKTLVVLFDNCRPQSSIFGHRDGAAISTHTPENVLPPPQETHELVCVWSTPVHADPFSVSRVVGIVFCQVGISRLPARNTDRSGLDGRTWTPHQWLEMCKGVAVHSQPLGHGSPLLTRVRDSASKRGGRAR